MYKTSVWLKYYMIPRVIDMKINATLSETTDSPRSDSQLLLLLDFQYFFFTENTRERSTEDTTIAFAITN